MESVLDFIHRHGNTFARVLSSGHVRVTGAWAAAACLSPSQVTILRQDILPRREDTRPHISSIFFSPCPRAVSQSMHDVLRVVNELCSTNFTLAEDGWIVGKTETFEFDSRRLSL